MRVAYEPDISNKQSFHLQCMMNIHYDLFFNTVMHHTYNESKRCTDV